MDQLTTTTTPGVPAGGATLALHGELDVATAGIAAARVAELLAAGRGRRLTIDLAGLTFVDSTAIELLRAARAHCDGRGVALRILPGGPSVQRVFELTGTDRTLPFAGA